MIKDNSRPSILEANFFYLFIGIILLLLGSYVQRKEIYSGLLITEFIIILIPTIFYLKMRGYSLKEVLRLNKISIKQALLIPLIVIFSYPIGTFFNYLMLIVLNYFGKISPNPVPIPENSQEMIIGLIVIALSAGICEEVMFRGFVMKAYEKRGMKLSIICSAILFGMFHFNIQNLLGPIYLGLIFGYIVHKTGSIFSSIIAHTANNAFALVLGMLVTKISIDPEMAADAAVSGAISDTTAMLIGGIGIGFVAVICGIIVFFLLKLLPGVEDKKSENMYSNIQIDTIIYEGEGIERSTKEGIASYIPIFLVLLIFIYVTYLSFKM
ncbi:type II CAAX endopeptidase family protein [Proteiniborus sp. MB09-C3]|uniref:type II CAAX endopeptidase family protein n=1 Tax=Proteiniborus sp. MB09-C3 TaxID=3050072 RepID=UPI002552FA2B|nr:type II CAAX endopeptidase family protein [Proteiniborus sp. MB09-C3]WIV11419.1 type II CAAX endopeptidase family protein [Proteiniborus sp. MB09-C3]